MATVEEKIIELSKLLAVNILTNEEFGKIVEIIKRANSEVSMEKTDEELKYNEYFKEYVLHKIKAPATAIYSHTIHR